MRVRRQKHMVLAFLGIATCLLALLCRLGYIQLVRAGELSRMAMALDTTMVALEEYSRGDILDRNGNSLTGAYTANRVVIIPPAIREKDRVVQELAAILNVQPAELDRFFAGEPQILPFDLTPGQAARVKQIFGTGITVLPVKHRYGPDPLASHVTGHLGKISSDETFRRLNSPGQKIYRYNDWIGVMGLEKYYEYQLKGEMPAGNAYMLVDARGRPVGESLLIVNNNRPDPGRYDVVTTIDGRVQEVVERILDRRVQKGAVVVMQPGSGDILACASRPDFHPEPGQIPGPDQGEQGIFVNRATSLFQPGSLFKIVLACAALEEGLADPGTVFTCRGAGDSPIRCWHEPGHGKISLHDAVVYSCNPAFVQLGRQLGAGVIIDYAGKLGLADTNITGLPAANNKQNFADIGASFNLANSSIGQGPVLTTPVQLTAMMNVIASGGLYYQPRIVKELRGTGGDTVEFPVSTGERAVSPGTTASLREMLEAVTGKGVGRNAFVEVWGSAGKTGSAQVRNRNGEAINAWFSGYVPVHKPRYVITVLIQDGESGGDTAAPVFQEIARELMKLEN